jgi:hypothetical protein
MILKFAGFLFLFIAIVLIGFGIRQLITPLDILWMRQERFLISRGISPHRNSAWEESVRGWGWVLIALGVVFFIIYLSPLQVSLKSTFIRYLL